MTAIHDAARRELQRGRQPIPVPSGQKGPILKGWPGLRLTEDDLANYFDGSSNLGILNGDASRNQVDVDLDCSEALLVADQLLPPTHAVFGRSGKRRSHRLYICDSLPATKQFEDTDGTMLVEVRSTGTQTVFPPSIHPSGEQITWEEDGEPARVDGRQLLAMVSKTAAATILARHWPAEGGRHGAALALAGALFRLGWCEDDVATFIEVVADAAGDEETRDRVAAARYTAQRLAEDKTATGWPRLAECVGQVVVDRLLEWFGVSNSGNHEHSEVPWEAPIPLDDAPRPEFPIAAFPEWLRTFVEALALATQTPRALAAMLVFAVLAAACARRIIVKITDDWFEPVNLFTVVAMSPAERKSAVFREVTQPIMEFEAAEMARLAPRIAEAASRQKITEQSLAKAQRAAADKSGPEQASLLARADELARDLATMEVPAMPRLVIDDCSAERVGSMLSEQGGRIAVMAPEGDVFDLMAGKYSATGTPNFGVYLRGHAGDDLRVDRVGRPGDFVRGPALTMGLAVQPEVIHGLAARPGFRGRGLLGRFLYAFPRSLLGRRATNPPPVPKTTRSTYQTKVTALLRLNPTPAKDPWDQPEPYVLRLSSSAADRFQAFRTELEPRLDELGDLGHIADWAGKLAGAVARIAGLLHMAGHVDSPTPWTIPISEATMAAAIRLGQAYLIPHALVAFAKMGADPALADAQHVLKVIAVRELEEFTKRDLFQIVKGRFRTVEALERALVVLEEHGYIRQRCAVARNRPGRKPSPTFDVNPVWRHNRSASPGQLDTAQPDVATVGVGAPPRSQNAHNPQNAWMGDDAHVCEGSEHSEEPTPPQEVMEWTAAL